MYETTLTANRCPFKWNTLPVFVRKTGQAQPRLIFNYLFIYKNILASHMEVATNVHNLLTIPSNKCLFSADIKHEYWVVNVYPDDRHYFAFPVPGIGHLQSTDMSQGARTSSFTFNELMNIVFRPILIPQPEPSLLHARTTKKFISLAFYIDGIFGAFETHQE